MTVLGVFENIVFDRRFLRVESLIAGLSFFRSMTARNVSSWLEQDHFDREQQ